MLSILNIASSSSIVIDGRTFDGKNIELKPFIDGKEVPGGTLSGSIKIEINGNCGDIDTMNGDVHVKGHCHSIETVNGDVVVGAKPLGSVTTVNGDIDLK